MKNKKDTKQSLRKMDIVEREIRETLERCGVGLTLGELKKMVFEEEGHKEFTEKTLDFIKGSEDNYEEILMMFTDAWNYFPHKSMGGLSPADKMREYEESGIGKNGDSKKSSEKYKMGGKLTPKQKDLLWSGMEHGEPYSQAKLTKEVRVLGDSVSRIFLIVDIEINPTTFEIIEQHRYDEEFEKDIAIQQLLDHADYRGPQFGYVATAFAKEYENDHVMIEADLALQRAQKTVIQMHKFVMAKYLK